MTKGGSSRPSVSDLRYPSFSYARPGQEIIPRSHPHEPPPLGRGPEAAPPVPRPRADGAGAWAESCKTGEDRQPPSAALEGALAGAHRAHLLQAVRQGAPGRRPLRRGDCPQAGGEEGREARGQASSQGGEALSEYPVLPGQV